MATKVCSKCNVEKPFSDYYKDNLRKIGIRCKCKECCSKETRTWRDRNRSKYNNYVAEWRAKNPARQHATEIKRRYSLSVEDYNARLSEQLCKCKICGKQHDPSVKRGRLYVDHDHKSGDVRGLLCGACNSAIGYMNDDVEIFEKAIAYLKSFHLQ